LCVCSASAASVNKHISTANPNPNPTHTIPYLLVRPKLAYYPNLHAFFVPRGPMLSDVVRCGPMWSDAVISRTVVGLVVETCFY